MTKVVKETDLNFELEKLKSRVSKLERYYHSNLKYIKDLYAKYDALKKNGNNGTA